MGKLTRIFHRLHWRLTLTYTLVTVAAVVLLEVILLVFLGSFFVRSDYFPTIIAQALENIATPELQKFIDQPAPDQQSLSQWMEQVWHQREIKMEDSGWSLQFSPMVVNWLVVVDASGQVLADRPPHRFNALLPLEDQLPLDQQPALLAVLATDPLTENRSLIDEDGNMIVAAPVLGADGELLGALAMNISYPSGLIGLVYITTTVILPSLPVVVGFAALVGLVFGFLTARSISRRLRSVSTAADSWSQGDFSAFIKDGSQDEIGQLAQRLNRMAEQLQNLLDTRQELATMEERNRLARDLHDSVKQQVFATSMQVGAAREVIDRDPQAALQHLAEAELLSRQAQGELTTLIRELRPAALDGKGLIAALQEFIQDWSRRNDIQAEMLVQGERSTPLEVEQALFRIAQEALANVARHSQAEHVSIQLSWDDGSLFLSIQDDGRGFDAKSPSSRGVGLRGMRERAEVLGGRLMIESSPGKGACITARFEIH